MLGLFITLAALGIAGYVVYDFQKEFRAAPGSLWDRVLAAGKGSATRGKVLATRARKSAAHDDRRLRPQHRSHPPS